MATNPAPRKLKQAEVLTLLDCGNKYFKESAYIGDKHRVEIIAAAAAEEGLLDLAGELTRLHSSMLEFHRGEYKSIEYLQVDNIGQELKTDAEGSKFEKAINSIVDDFSEAEEVLKSIGREVDWAASAPVFVKVKQKSYPDDLSMTEKLGIWHAAQQAAPPKAAHPRP